MLTMQDNNRNNTTNNKNNSNNGPDDLTIETASPDLSFPWRLYLLLRDAERQHFEDVISWTTPEVFQIHDVKAMESSVLGRYFASSRYSSFRRQLIAYGFESLGNRQYRHEQFHKQNLPHGCSNVVRQTRTSKTKDQTRTVKQQQIMTVAAATTTTTQISPEFHPITSPPLASPYFHNILVRNLSQQQQGFMLSPVTPPTAVSTSSSSSSSFHSHVPGKVPIHSSSDESDGQDDFDDLHSASATTYSSSASPSASPLPSYSQYRQRRQQYNDHVLLEDEEEQDEDGLSFDDDDFEPLPYQQPRYDGDSFSTKIVTTTRSTTGHNTLEQLWMSMSTNLESLLQPRNITSVIQQQQQENTSNIFHHRESNYSVNSNDGDDQLLEKLLEPRSIQEMISSSNTRTLPPPTAPYPNGNLSHHHQQQPSPLQYSHGTNNTVWFDHCPYMTPQTQAIAEYMLPCTLPMIFYLFDVSWIAYVWAFVLVVGHTVECMFTNFLGDSNGHGTPSSTRRPWYYKDVFGPIQHMQMDLLWNHLMISWFFFYGPATYGSNTYRLGLSLIPTLPTMIAVDTKSHFMSFIIISKDGESSTSLSSSLSQSPDLQRRMDDHLRRSTVLYVSSMVLLGVSSFYGTAWTQVVSIMYFNLCPIITDLSYWKEFGVLLERLPNKLRTVLHQKHINYVLGTIRRTNWENDRRTDNREIVANKSTKKEN